MCRSVYHAICNDIQPKIIIYYLKIHINIAESCKGISKIWLSQPGASGEIFIHPAKQYMTVVQLLKTQEGLVRKTMSPVIYIEDRRTEP